MSREMKDSGIEWIGEIPKDWDYTRMKSCISQRDSGAWGNEANEDEQDIVCLRVADFNYSVFRFKDTEEGLLTKRSYNEDIIKKLILRKNDIVIEKSGGGEKTPVGRTVIFDKGYRAVYANFCDRLRCRKMISPQFMQYVFATFYAYGYVWNYIKQTTGIQNLDLTAMLALEKIAFPFIEEQDKIVRYLNGSCIEIGNILEKTRASIEEYKKLKQAVITKAVTKGVRGNREIKDSQSTWFGYIPSDWKMRKIKYIFKIQKDIAGEEGHTVLSITQKGIKPKDLSKNEGQLAENYSKYQLVHIGDFAMNHMDLLTGWVDVSKYEGVTSPDYRVFGLIDKDNYCSQYYLYLMQMCYTNRIFYGLGQGVSGLGRWRLQADKFLNFSITVPSYEEQKEIANYLDQKCSAMDELIAKKEQYLSEIENYKNSLIYEYVTGKKEV